MVHVALYWSRDYIIMQNPSMVPMTTVLLLVRVNWLDSGLEVKAPNYSVRGRGFEYHQLLPRKGYYPGSLVSLPT